MPNPEMRIAALIARGIVPSEAERIVAEVDARGNAVLQAGEAELLAMPTDEGMTMDRLWPYYTPDIPNQYRRLWTARVIDA